MPLQPLKLFKSPLSRKALTTGASISATSTTIQIPPSATFLNTGSPSLEASQAASIALSELSQHLDTCLSEIDFDGDLSAQRRQIERRLTLEAEKYANCALRTPPGAREWYFTQKQAALVSIAMGLSDTAYDNVREPSPEQGFSMLKQWYIPASVNGTTKATTFTVVTPDPDTADGYDVGEGLPLLVIAVKGSRSVADWMVNSNGTPRDVPAAGEFLKHCPAAPRVHSGFLHCAHDLLLPLTRELHKQIRDQHIRHVLFTGHSAGGAVSALLFTHYLTIAHRDYKNIRFSLVTFGAPPVISPDITPLLINCNPQNQGALLAICNEHDPVPRADGEYIRSLLDLHRSAYGLAPLPSPEPSPTSTVSSNSKTKSNPPESTYDRITSNGEWIVPAAVLHPLGRLIVLKDKNADAEGTDLYAYEVKTEEFEKLLFVKVGAHRRGVYLENMEMVRKGLVNGGEGW